MIEFKTGQRVIAVKAATIAGGQHVEVVLIRPSIVYGDCWVVEDKNGHRSYVLRKHIRPIPPLRLLAEAAE